MLVFAEWFNGVHVAHIITSSAKQKDLAPWMNALNDILYLSNKIGVPMCSLLMMPKLK
jgi:hypothetical protein